MKKTDLVLLISPFVLTFVFLVIGYNILIQQTPEARIGIFDRGREDEIIFLQEPEVTSVPPQGDIPTEFSAVVVSLPQNYLLVDRIIERAESQKAQVVYISLPVEVKSDYELTLSDALVSNQVNVLRWLKLTTSTLHENGYHVAVAMNLNASETVKDPALFAHTYAKLLQEIATTLEENRTSYFLTGITVGHPLYSQLPPLDTSRIMATVLEKVKEKFIGRVGFSLCCTIDFEILSYGYDVVTLIPTPEFGFGAMRDLTQLYLDEDLANLALYYDRDRSLVLTQSP